MPAKAFILQELLEVVWHSNQIELDLSLVEVNSGGVNVSEN